MRETSEVPAIDTFDHAGFRIAQKLEAALISDLVHHRANDIVRRRRQQDTTDWFSPDEITAKLPETGRYRATLEAAQSRAHGESMIKQRLIGEEPAFRDDALANDSQAQAGR
jgi:hypothetical protein